MAPFHHRLRVRYNECDQQNAVFNANYLTYCDVAITELWRESMGSYEVMSQKHGVDLVVAEAHVRFIKPARFDDELEIAVEIERLGNTAITSRFEITRGGDLVAEAAIRHVVVGVEDGTKTAIPEDIRRALEPYSAP